MGRVIDNVGEQLDKGEFCTALRLREARESYDSWVKTELVQQTLAMRTGHR